jgi:beta-glucosidase
MITEKQIDVSVERLFTIRFRLGMFDPEENVPFSKIGVTSLEAKPHQDHALKMANEAIVLLKNENNVLPLSKSVKKIAVVGPNADDKDVLLANYYGYPSKITTVLEGINRKVGNQVIYEKGVNIVDNNVFKPAYQKNAFSLNGKPGFQAEYFQNDKFEGTPVIVRTGR